MKENSRGEIEALDVRFVTPSQNEKSENFRMKTLTVVSSVVAVAAIGAAVFVIADGGSDFRALAAADELLAAGDARSAAGAYRGLIEKGGDASARARVHLGVALERQGDLDGSIRALREAASFGPGAVKAQAFAYLGYSLYRKGLAEEAVEAYDRAIEEKIDAFPDVHFNRGVALKKLERHADAAAALERYASEAGNGASPAALLELAEAYFNAERYADCRRNLVEYVKSGPDRESEPRVVALRTAFDATVAAAKATRESKP